MFCVFAGDFTSFHPFHLHDSVEGGIALILYMGRGDDEEGDVCCYKLKPKSFPI